MNCVNLIILSVDLRRLALDVVQWLDPLNMVMKIQPKQRAQIF